MQGLPLRSNLCSDLFVSNFTVIYLVAVAAPFHPFHPQGTFSSDWKSIARKTRETLFVFISFRSSQLVPAIPMAREARMGG